MVSDDFKSIMQRIHKDKYAVVGFRIHAERRDDEGHFGMQATITLGKDREKVVVETSQPDCIMYVAQLRRIVETDGEILFAPIVNADQYNKDIEFLVDRDRKKLESARGDLVSKKFVFSYKPIGLVDELLESPARTRMLDHAKYSRLLEDYFHILALVLSESQRFRCLDIGGYATT